MGIHESVLNGSHITFSSHSVQWIRITLLEFSNFAENVTNYEISMQKWFWNPFYWIQWRLLLPKIVCLLYYKFSFSLTNIHPMEFKIVGKKMVIFPIQPSAGQIFPFSSCNDETFYCYWKELRFIMSHRWTDFAKKLFCTSRFVDQRWDVFVAWYITKETFMNEIVSPERFL